MTPRARPQQALFCWLPLLLSACHADPAQYGHDSGVYSRWDARAHDSATHDIDAGGLPPATYAPTFTAIYAEFFETQHCLSVFCHGIGGAVLDLSSQEVAYRSLVHAAAEGFDCKDRGHILVVPGDPESSLVWAKVSQDDPPCGARMPRFPGLLLNDQELTQLRTWIERGAPND